MLAIQIHRRRANAGPGERRTNTILAALSAAMMLVGGVLLAIV